MLDNRESIDLFIAYLYGAGFLSCITLGFMIESNNKLNDNYTKKKENESDSTKKG